MNSAVRQARKGIIDLINVDPETIIYYKKPLISDGMGGFTEDPFGVETAVTIKVRISHERKAPDTLSETGAGLSTNLGRFITSDYKNPLKEGVTFEALNLQWRIGSVDVLTIKGQIYGYQAALTEAS